MKKIDLIFALIVIAFFAPFFLVSDVYEFYASFNKEHGMITSFIKFAILATMGEIIGLRIRIGKYNQKGFGILPRMLVWGLLGLTIKAAFVIFAKGAPIFLEYMGVENVTAAMKGDFTNVKFLGAFTISVTLNLIFSPVLMTFHKITDIHISNNKGTLRGLFRTFRFGQIIESLDWHTQWNFVFKKTIPLFWIPAHTLTFMLPPDSQILFAALLGIALGVILAIAHGK